MRRLCTVDRRALTVLAAAGALIALPAVAHGTTAEALLAQSAGGTLTADAFAAGSSSGTLSDTATPAGKKPTGATAAASADQLPLTGSDPRLTLMLGLAAALAGAGMRLRTRDARDY